MLILLRTIYVLLILVGAVFALQGANILTDSAVMSGLPLWLYIGIALVVVGLVGLVRTFVSRPRW